MSDFVFGSLSTTEKRAAYLQKRMRGVRHENRVEPTAVFPQQSPIITVTVELDQIMERLECVMDLPETAVYPLHFIKTEWDMLNWAYYQVWQIALPPQPAGTLVRYQIIAHLSDGSQQLADDGAAFSYYVGNHQPPEWTADAIIYQIFPDRFAVENGRFLPAHDDLNAVFGGTIRGIIDKLDYISEMGFNCIWLNPIFPDNSHHGYHATDYFSVNPRLGTLADIRELVEKCHQRGIRLLLDFVANHWGSDHDSFIAAQADRHSPYHDWYNWKKWPDEYESFFGVAELPQINTDHPAVRDYLFRSVTFWLTEIGFDGLRLDYVLGPSLDFWTALYAHVKTIKPDAWLYGEAVTSPDEQLVYNGRFDGTLDFVVAQAMRDTFARESMNIVAFDALLNQHEQFMPASFSRPSFLDNHDMDRFLWAADGDKRKLKLAALCQFTLAGAPIVYNGSEVGVNQNAPIHVQPSQGMAECRQPMVWGDDQDADLRDYFRWLIGLRREHAVLRNGRRRTLVVDGKTAVYVYLRDDGQEKLLVALNLGHQAQTVTVTVDGKPYTIALAPQQGEVVVVKQAV